MAGRLAATVTGAVSNATAGPKLATALEAGINVLTGNERFALLGAQ